MHMPAKPLFVEIGPSGSEQLDRSSGWLAAWINYLANQQCKVQASPSAV
jgi:hypothetical protein